MERGPAAPTARHGAGQVSVVPFSARVRIRPTDPALAAATFEASYASYAAEIRAYLLHRTRDPGVADDLTQEAFLRFCREIAAGRTPLNTRAWLYRVAANLAASRGRRLDVARRWLDGAGPDGWDVDADAPEAAALRRDLHDRLQHALVELPHDTRVALLMAASGFSGREIALALGRSEVATRTLLFRGRLRLRTRLLAEELGPDVTGAAAGPPRPVADSSVACGCGIVAGCPTRRATIGS